MLARACERVGWSDLAWILFARIEQEARDPAAAQLAGRGRQALGKPAETLVMRAGLAGIVSGAALARARQAGRDDETPLSWLVRQDAFPFDRLVDLVLAGAPLPPARPIKERIGMRLLAERKISQGDLKQALSRQAHDSRPLGAILVQEFSLPAATLQAALQAQAPLAVRLGAQDMPPALLIRWGALKPEDWEVARIHGPRAFEILVAQGQVLPANVRRADAYRSTKQRYLREGRFRLGAILVERGLIDSETLAKALAWQVDQPYRLGELLVRYRLASVEGVLEGLIEQARRYDAAVEASLPPVEAPPPPPAETAPTPSPPPPSRRKLAYGALAGIVLLAALGYGMRYSEAGFGWLSAFAPQEDASERRGPGVAELLGGSQSSGPRRERGTAFDPLNLPPGELSSQAVSTPLGEGMLADGMLAEGSAEGFIGTQSGDPFLGSPLPRAEGGYPLSAGMGFEAVGTPSEAEALGTSGEQQSVTYAPQSATGGRQRETSRERELEAARQIRYPMQAQQTLGDNPAQALGGSIQPRISTGEELQPPLALTQRPAGSPADSLQVRQETAVFRLRLGISLYERKDAASAREEFLSAIGLDPTLAPPHYYLGRIAEDRGDKLLARTWYESYLARAAGGENADEVRERLRGIGD